MSGRGDPSRKDGFLCEEEPRKAGRRRDTSRQALGRRVSTAARHELAVGASSQTNPTVTSMEVRKMRVKITKVVMFGARPFWE